jgi:hypothetical protein
MMERKCPNESRLLPHAQRVAVLAFALLALQCHGGATPASAAAPKATVATANPLAAATEKWEGYWAKIRKECRYSDGPDSKTMIDLKNSENGKPAPLYDQYENHCRIDSHATKGNVTTLKLTCFEFWDDYKAKKNPRRGTVTVTAVDQNSIRISGAAYIRCRK